MIALGFVHIGMRHAIGSPQNFLCRHVLQFVKSMLLPDFLLLAQYCWQRLGAGVRVCGIAVSAQ